MFKNIQTILEKFIEKDTRKDYLEYKSIQKKWAKKINKKTQKSAQVVDFTEGTITIKTKNPAWKNEILFMQDEIKKNFQTKTTQ